MATLFLWLRHVVRLGCGAGLSLVAFVAHAQSEAALLRADLTGFVAEVGPGGATGRYVRQSTGQSAAIRTWLAEGASFATGKVVATESVAVAGRGGSMAVSAAARISAADAAVAVGRCMLVNPVCIAATAVATIAYAHYRVKHPSNVPGSLVPEGSLDYDPGTGTENVTGWSFVRIVVNSVLQPQCTGSTPSLAFDCIASQMAQITHDGTGYNVRFRAGVCTGSVGTSSCVLEYQRWYTGQFPLPAWTNYGTYVASSGTITRCPASTDFSDPQYNVPPGSPVGPDGKCPTARYHHVPISPELASQKLLDYPPAWPSAQWRDATKQAVEQGKQSVPANVTTSGPASQVGAPTVSTTTNPDGTTTTTTKTPTTNYQYPANPNGNFTWNTTTVTVVNNNGQTTTTTETPPAPAAGDPAPTDGLCDLYPGILACAKLGSGVDVPSLYEKKAETFEDAVTGFRGALATSPLGQAAGGFFTVELSGGTCPTWSAEVPFLEVTITLDFMCWQVFGTLLTTLAVVLNVVAAFVSFRVAFL